MFGQITEQFQSIFKNIRGLGKITDSNIKNTVRMIRRTLIDADVNFKNFKGDSALSIASKLISLLESVCTRLINGAC